MFSNWFPADISISNVSCVGFKGFPLLCITCSNCGLLKSANTVVVINCATNSSGVGTGVATDVNTAAKFVGGNTGASPGGCVVGNPAIGWVGGKTEPIKPAKAPPTVPPIFWPNDNNGDAGGVGAVPIAEIVTFNAVGATGSGVGATTGGNIGAATGAGVGAATGAATKCAVTKGAVTKGAITGATVGNIVAVVAGRVAKDATPVVAVAVAC